MNNKTFPRLACAFMMCFTFFLLPFNDVYADGYSSDSDYWRWWYIEHTTDEITNGSGASAEKIENTDSGQTAGTVIYNQSGVTRGDIIDYVEEQYNTAEGYIKKGVDYYVDAVNHVYDSTVTTATKAAYQTEKAVREVVDSTGKVIVDVSGSDFWHSAYNGLFNGNGYKDIYVNGNSNTVNGTVNGHNVSISFAGYVIDGQQIAVSENISNTIRQVVNTSATSTLLFDSSTPIVNNSVLNRYDYMVFNITVDGVTCLIANARYYSQTEFVSGEFQNSLYVYLYNETVYVGYTRQQSAYIVFYNTVENVTTGGNPVLQPKQCGFIIYNGDRVSVYTDPTQNPFTINDDGTVDYNGNTYPIYVDPDEISPDGWLKILEFIDNEDQTQNPYNPQGKPWNTQPDGSILGGFFSSLISDIGNLFSSLVDTIKSLLNGLIDMIKAIFIPKDFDFSQLFDFEIDDNFGLIQQIIEDFLQAVGVTAT